MYCGLWNAISRYTFSRRPNIERPQFSATNELVDLILADAQTPGQHTWRNVRFHAGRRRSSGIVPRGRLEGQSNDSVRLLRDHPRLATLHGRA